MAVLFQGDVHVHYGQMYVESRVEDFFDGLTDTMPGQSNGLCGATVPGLLYLITGLHTGNVPLTIEALDAAPPLTDEWDEAVEVSFRPSTARIQLVQWAAEASWPLALAPRDYRVRYSAVGMDAASDQDTRMDGEPYQDRYRLQFWPGAPAPDAVLRQTSRTANYWHGHARSLPPPPTPEERAATERERRLAEEMAQGARAYAAQARRWGGRLPSKRVREAQGAKRLNEVDRALLDALDNLDDGTLRAIAVWAARRAYEVAGLDALDWAAAALGAVERGEPLPAPYTEPARAFEVMRADPRLVRTSVPSYDGRHPLVSRQHMALPAVFSAASADPMSAACHALSDAIVAFGNEYRTLLAEVRKEFPAIAQLPPHSRAARWVR